MGGGGAFHEKEQEIVLHCFNPCSDDELSAMQRSRSIKMQTEDSVINYVLPTITGQRGDILAE